MSDQTNNDDNEDNKPEMKVTFAEGCFDDFEGTQEELDELVAHIKEMAASGELLENSVALEDIKDIENVEEFVGDIVNLAQLAEEKYGFDEEGFVKFPFNNTRH